MTDKIINLEMRELMGDDIFPISSIAAKLNVKDDIVSLFAGDDQVKQIPFPEHKERKLTKKEEEAFIEAQQLREQEANKLYVRTMANVVQRVLGNLELIKDDLNELLGNLTGNSAKEIGKLNLVNYTSLIVKFFKKEELKDVFTSIASLFGTEEVEEEVESSD